MHAEPSSAASAAPAAAPADAPSDGGGLLALAAARGDWVRLRTLVALRWMAVLGQAAAVLVADLWLGVQLPIGACAALIAASACVNIVAQAVHPRNKRLTERETLLFLLFDLAQLGALLMLTGGLSNPFAVLILAPVVISATALTLASTILLGAFAAGLVTLLALGARPLRLADGATLQSPPLIVAGSWVALIVAMAFLAAYARRVTAENFAMSLALSATQEALSREQRLTAIGGLAAAAAHELGTPLATIKLAASELARELDDRPDLREDAELIRDQAERCRQILRELARGGKDDTHIRSAPVSAVIEEAAAPHADRGKRLVLRLRGRPAGQGQDPAQPLVRRRPELIHGLRNLVQNAVDFAASTVWIDVDWDEETLRIAVGDDGPGYGPELLGRLGDPYVRRRARPAAAPAGRAGYEGMGLGLFIAKTLLERTGARIHFADAADAEARAQAPADPERGRPTGAVVTATWRRAALEAARGRAEDNPRFGLNNI
ncbi:sensor histidine kinase RegB [Oceanicella actignis]|uniref:histidine kinase n=1 Tax=Oceanicella actignis TaxID=1189325 RepID=A0A1M7S1Q8_9RHOB|nr:ActS/PrrB/RegB family redox-sensitive histidine kinase [Oceanicella actignis]SES90763.1 two-component system, sensor histidine kinase RegB [Oceanicella actignis]SHN52569.1 two-component system, sensor histidine kinase RegB [Oceanicella actignis]